MLRGGIHYQYQQQLQRLLNDHGFEGDLPSSFYSSIPPGSELMKWLVTTLEATNFVLPADVALAVEYSKAREALEQDRADLRALADQGLQPDGTPGAQDVPQDGDWLGSQQPLEEDEARLAELQQEHALMKAQLQEMQALERSLDAAQQAQRAQQQQADAAAMRDAKILSTEAASLAQLNDKLNAQLEGLNAIIREVHQLITAHGRRWLLLASNMDGYMEEDKRFVDTILQYTATSVEAGAQAAGHAPPKASAAASGAGSSALDESAMKELKRLRMAFYLSEMEYVQAQGRLAGAQAMASELEAMVAQMGPEQASSGAPWLEEGARRQLAARVHTLEQEQERLMQQEVPILVTELAQLQDTYVFQGEGALKEAQLQRRIALVHQVVEALVGQGARHLVLDALRQQEQRTLQAVLGMVKEAGAHVASLSSGMEARVHNYQRAAAAVAAAGLTCGTSSSLPLTSAPSFPPSLSPHSPPPSHGQQPSLPPPPAPASPLSPHHPHPQQHRSLHSPAGTAATAAAAGAALLGAPQSGGRSGGSSSSSNAGGLHHHIAALQLALADGEAPGAAGANSTLGMAPYAGTSSSSPLPVYPHPLQQQQQLGAAVAQCAEGLAALQAHMEAVLEEVQAAALRWVPEQVDAATAAASRAHALVFPPPPARGLSPGALAAASSSSSSPSRPDQQHGASGGAAPGGAGAKPATQQHGTAVGGQLRAAKPVLCSPELMAALQQLTRLNEALQAATNEVVVGYQEHTARLERHKADAALERSVLKMFYLDPQKLEETVTELQSRLDAATAAAT